jgi:hypothetical protein
MPSWLPVRIRGRYVTEDFGVGVAWTPSPAAARWPERWHGVAPYFGGGLSVMEVSLVRDQVVLSEEHVPGAFIHAGLQRWWKLRSGSFLCGLEVRGRLGEDVEMLGRRVETHALDLLLVIGWFQDR